MSLNLTNIRTVYILLILLAVYTANVCAQDEGRYTLHIENESLGQVLKEIRGETGYKFAYSRSEVDIEKRGSFSFSNQTIDSIIQGISDEFNLRWEIVGNTIILNSHSSQEGFLISGAVLDSKQRLPLQWVNISTPDNLHGTLTDSHGKFSLRVPADQQGIKFSFVGFKTQVAEIYSDTTLLVLLLEDITAFEEIVVVAFGKENKDLITGSVAVHDPKLYNQLNTESVNASLQASLSGVLVQNNAGTPGSATNVTIRGISSITAGNRPLYIVDGIPMISGNYSQLDFSGQTIDAITDLSIYDIESISVLKDAAAGSLYGASSSNGVILINTKTGWDKKNQIHIESYYGLQQAAGKLSMLDARQWKTLVNEEAIDAGEPPVYSGEDIEANEIDTDWLDEVFRAAPTYNVFLSSTGGNEKMKYYVSGNYFNQEGIVIGSNYNRYSFRVNYDYQLSKKLSLQAGNGFTYSRNGRIEGDQSLNGPLPTGISMPPVFPVYNPDGSYNNDGPYANPVSIANEEKNLAFSYRNIFNFTLNYQVNDRLLIKSQTGIDFYNLGEQTFAPKNTRQGAKYNGLGIEATNNTIFLYNSTYFRYNYSQLDHHVSILGGFSLDSYRRHGTYLRAQNFPGNSFQFLQDAATPIIASSHELDAASNSIFGSIKYNYTDKYILDFNVRRDGSSKFGVNNRFGWFPSVSALWYLSREDFWKKEGAISKLKFKASYGLTGNDQISDFIALDLFAAGANYFGEAGIAPYQLSNPDLKWETTRQLNIGVHMELSHKYNLFVEYYLKRTSDLLLENPIPTSSGYEYYISNIGKIQNQGFEIELTASVLSEIIKWDASISISANQNRVLQLYQDQPIRNIGRASSSIEVGEPVSFFYGFISEGVNPDNGLLIYKDYNQDGMINDLDRTRIGSPFPLFFGGFNNSIAYKSWRLDMLIYYSYGNDIFNSTRLYTETVSIGNQTTAVINRWKEAGDITEVPRASSYNNRISSRFVEDGSYIRLKSLKLSYNFKSQLIKNWRLTSLEVYLAGKNLITLTNYSGMDPEVNYNSSNSIIMGTDFFTCPQAKTILLGVCVKF